MRIFIFVFACLLQLSLQKSTPQDDHYIAAVVEYQVQSDISVNVQNYVRLIKEASEQNADIMVFPEMTLTRGNRSISVPIFGILKEYPVPADRPDLYDEMLVTFSQTAKQYQIYVVINIQEIVDCNDAPGEYCPEKKVYLFNTNVVFDRNGAVIDRYRKINLFGEFSRTPAFKPDLGIFSTDFGVTFGHYICFDLMFQVPAVQVVEKHKLTDVIFTTMWFSEMPYLTAVQIHQGYAYAMNVNFLAAGANNVRVGSAGSGIYSGKAGTLVGTMPGVPTTRLMVAKVPKVPGKVTEPYPGPIYDNPSDHDGLVLKQDPSLPSHISKPLVQGLQEFTLVDKEVSCKFRINLNQRSGETVPFYRAFVQDGSNTYVLREIGVAACGVVACKNDDVKICPYRFSKDEQNTEFEELEILMTTYRHHYNSSLQCDDVVYFPSTLRNNKFPFDPKNVTFIDNTQITDLENSITDSCVNEKGTVLFKLNVPQNQLVSFGIWGRLYNRDVNLLKNVTQEDVENSIRIENIIYGV
ncbi:vanin-like protein 2 isoform X2 [Epargyreus clarus]|uniref:vanin-like protein 2 isoform X2 n=1 Tax=Epargyreus clarus TaxID=520877 RepID=UPI003C2E2374